MAGREIAIMIDETGDRKKGSTTDYVKRQYIGNLEKIENGIVAVTAYGLLGGMKIPSTGSIIVGCFLNQLDSSSGGGFVRKLL